MRPEDLKPFQLDGIKEIANIGGAHAATALSEMVNKPIMVNVPRVVLVNLEDVVNLVGTPDDIVVGILINFGGDIYGKTLLVFPKKEALMLVDLLMGKSLGETQEFDEMGKSSLSEVANILVSSYLTALSEFLGLMFLPSTPNMSIDQAGAVVTSSYIEEDSPPGIMFCVETEFFFKDPEVQLKGYLLLLPDEDGLSDMLKALKLQ